MTITELWIQHTNTKFPSDFGGKDVNGVCVTSVDSYASGCISSFVNKESGSLDIERFQILQKCEKELEKVLPFVENEAFEYFSRLYSMCGIVISEAKIA
ncbi:hypothetical protein [uncultured Pseudoteredinibacter sp.]|uniref:hypothetical protein n=1 Tax=uncultured Pseudoteredinibacter sp. TaxID=1641701 RepID=UPI002638C120|nr:hypothetical protein [uncultured Pseudoteredinibacter sp.]